MDRIGSEKSSNLLLIIKNKYISKSYIYILCFLIFISILFNNLNFSI
jgi:hypothetical protein